MRANAPRLPEISEFLQLNFNHFSRTFQHFQAPLSCFTTLMDLNLKVLNLSTFEDFQGDPEELIIYEVVYCKLHLQRSTTSHPHFTTAAITYRKTSNKHPLRTRTSKPQRLLETRCLLEHWPRAHCVY